MRAILAGASLTALTLALDCVHSRLPPAVVTPVSRRRKSGCITGRARGRGMAPEGRPPASRVPGRRQST
jgi:hypothetical protein